MTVITHGVLPRVAWLAQAAAIAALAALLAGCPSQPRRAPLPALSWEARRSELQQRQQFALRGRVAVAAGKEGFNAGLRWVQQGARSDISLDGPLGVGGAQVSLDGETLQVRTSKGEGLSDAAARAELTARLGFDPPLRSLRYWIQGVPDPSTPAQETLDTQQRLATLQQDGWQISYPSYRAGLQQWLPERVTLERDTVRVRMVIGSWEP